MSDYVVKVVTAAIEQALNPKGMSVHDGKVKLNISHAQALLRELIAAEQKLSFYTARWKAENEGEDHFSNPMVPTNEQMP